MKRIIVLLASIALSASVLSAQTITPGMKYKDLKDMYNPKEYVKSDVDPYSKTWAGICSFLSPGTGQIVAGEVGRGFRFMLGSALVAGVGSYAADGLVENVYKDANDEYQFVNKDKAMTYFWVLMGSGVAELVMAVWSASDAVKVAKVKNMYYQDLMKRYGVSAQVYPSFSFVEGANGLQPTAGMTLSVSF